MALTTALENGYIKLTDSFFARWPGPTPSFQQLEHCKLVSHRGEHDNLTIMENSIAAFDKAASAGVWGLEMDLRWTRDLRPVIIHDSDLQRLFGDNRRINQMTRQQLRSEFPLIPWFEEVITRYGGRRHLMIEIKETAWPDASRQNQILKEVLSDLSPGKDYHFLALSPETLAPATGIPKEVQIPIAYHWPHGMFRMVRDSRWGGLCGHYSLMGNRMVHRLKAHGKRVGTGYPASPKCLFREIRRGVDWIFSNNASELQGIINDSLIHGQHIQQ
jgi:glycerophosphoryl diester phosphodiesterase